MNIIFNSETEIGIYNSDQNGEFRFAEPSLSTIVARTRVSRHRKMIRIEQSCSIRQGEWLPEKTFLQPQTVFEPTFATDEETRELAEVMHEQYVAHARKAILPENQITRRHRCNVFA